jgi:hypothetical protein
MRIAIVTNAKPVQDGPDTAIWRSRVQGWLKTRRFGEKVCGDQIRTTFYAVLLAACLPNWCVRNSANHELFREEHYQCQIGCKKHYQLR